MRVCPSLILDPASIPGRDSHLGVESGVKVHAGRGDEPLKREPTCQPRICPGHSMIAGIDCKYLDPSSNAEAEAGAGAGKRAHAGK